MSILQDNYGNYSPQLDPPDLSGCLPHSPRGCLGGAGPPAPGTPGVPGQLYFDTTNDVFYVFYNHAYHKLTDIVGTGAIQVFSGHYGGVQPATPIPDPTVKAAFNYDLDAPFQTWKWDSVALNWGA